MSSVEGIQQTLYFDKVTPIDLIEVDVSSDSEESSHCFMSPHSKFPAVSTDVKTANAENKTVTELKKNRLRNKLASRRWRTRRRATLDELKREELTEEIKNDRYKVLIKKLEQAYEEVLYIFEEVQLEKVKRRKDKSNSLDSGALKLAGRDSQEKTIDNFDQKLLEDKKLKTIIKEEYLEEHEGVLKFVERGQQDIFGLKISEKETVKRIKIETTLKESEDEIFIAKDLHEKTRNDFDEVVLEEEEEEVVMFKTETELVEESENLHYLSGNVQGNKSHLEVQEEEENVVWLKTEKLQDGYGALKCESEGFKVENVKVLNKVLTEEEEEIKSIMVEAGIEVGENLQYLSVNVQGNSSLETNFLSDEVINISSSDSDSSNCSKPVHHDIPVPVCLLVNPNRKIMSKKDKRRFQNKEACQRFRIRKKARLDNLLREEMIELNKNKKYKTFIKQLEQVSR